MPVASLYILVASLFIPNASTFIKIASPFIPVATPFINPVASPFVSVASPFSLLFYLLPFQTRPLLSQLHPLLPHLHPSKMIIKNKNNQLRPHLLVKHGREGKQAAAPESPQTQHPTGTMPPGHTNQGQLSVLPAHHPRLPHRQSLCVGWAMERVKTIARPHFFKVTTPRGHTDQGQLLVVPARCPCLPHHPHLCKAMNEK